MEFQAHGGALRHSHLVAAPSIPLDERHLPSEERHPSDRHLQPSPQPKTRQQSKDSKATGKPTTTSSLAMNLAAKAYLLGAVYLTAGITAADSAGTEQKVTVGKNGLGFDPPHVSAKKGDTITFVFFQDGHTLTQTHFANPCAGTNPPSDPFCTVTSTSSKNDSSSYPTGTSDYPTGGLQPPANAPFPTGGSNYPTSTDPPKDPKPDSSPTAEPSPAPGPPPVKDPSSNPPQCLCPAPPTTSSAYPTGPEPTSPKVKTCDSKCIEVSGQCQTSTDCDAQSKSPSNTQCKIKDGQCKKCGQGINLLKKKRSLNNYGFPYFGRRLRRRDASADDAVQKIDVTDAAATLSVDNTSQLNTAPSDQGPTLPTSPDATSRTDQHSSPPEGVDLTATSDPGLGAGSTSTSQQEDANTLTSADQTDRSTTAKLSGLDSGFVKVGQEQKSSGKTWTIQITDDSKPLWFMCATLHHCTKGMVFAVNAPDSGDKTFDRFVQTAKASTCSTQYPTQPNLQGDGCTAAAPPCEGQKKEAPSIDPATRPGTSGGKPPEEPKTTPAPPTQNQPTSTVTSGERKDPPPGTPSPDPRPPQGSTTNPEAKTSSQGHRSNFAGNSGSLILYLAIPITSFTLTGGLL